MTTDTIVLRSANEQMAPEFRKTLLEKHPAGFGLAVAVDGQVLVHYVPGADYPLAESLDKCEKEYKGHRVAYAFWGGEKVREENYQPYVLLNDGEGETATKQLVCLIDAELPDFQARNADGEDYSPGYFFVNQYLVGKPDGSDDEPLMGDLVALTDGDIPVIMKLLGKEKNEQQQAIKTKLGARGMCLLMAGNDETLGIVSGMKGEEFPWGMSTRTWEAKKPATGGLSLNLKTRATDKDKEKKEEKPDSGTEVDPKVEFASLLTKPYFYLKNNQLLYWKPENGSKLQAAKAAWNRNTDLPVPTMLMDGSPVVDAKKLYEGFPVANLKPNAPAADAVDKFYGKKKEPKTADSVQGPVEPPKKEEDKKPPVFAYLIQGNDKLTYMGMKRDGKLPLLTVEQMSLALKENPVASIQLDEPYDETTRMSPIAFGRLPGHIRTALYFEACCRLHGLVQGKASEKDKHVLAKQELQPEKKTLSLNLKKTGT